MTSEAENPPFLPTTEATLLVEELSAALVNVRIYATNHPRVANALAAVRRSVHALAQGTGEPRIRIVCIEGLLVFAQKPLRGASIGAARLIAQMEQWGTNGIEFDADVGEDALQRFFAAFVARPRPGASYAVCNQELEQQGCRTARMLPPYVENSAGRRASLRVALSLYQAAVDLLQNVTVSVCRGGQIDFAPVEAQAEKILDHLARSNDLQSGVARHDQYDAFTLGHSLRVAILAMNFARSITDDRELLIRIGTAALLHDVGKALVPFEVLHSATTLSPEERRQMDMHAELGAKVLLDHEHSDPLAVAAAFGHHRGPDGTGYPRTTHRHPVNLVTAIVKICDVFEALTAARPYKQSMSPIRAYRVMIAMGDKLDQRLLRRFLEVNGVYPVGQLVELENGDVAIVRGQTRDPLAPELALVGSPGELDVPADDEAIFTLGDVSCCSARAILRELTPDGAKAALETAARDGAAQDGGRSR
jgi:putative nucleotidyltransferase with HDIG domain